MKHTFLFLTFFCLSFFVAADSGSSPAQDTSENKILTRQRATQANFGPAVKNPLAAGRAGHPENLPTTIVATKRKALIGPAFKNRRVRIKPRALRRENRPSTAKRLMGPRYKNRSAKTGG